MWREETNMIQNLPILASNSKTFELSRATVTLTRLSPTRTWFHVKVDPSAPSYANKRYFKEFQGDVLLDQQPVVRTINYTPKEPDKYKDSGLYEWVRLVKEQIIPYAVDFNLQEDYQQACTYWTLVTEKILDRSLRNLRRQKEQLSHVISTYNPMGISRYGGEIDRNMNADVKGMVFAEGQLSGVFNAISMLGGVYVDPERVAYRLLVVEEFKEDNLEKD